MIDNIDSYVIKEHKQTLIIIVYKLISTRSTCPYLRVLFKSNTLVMVPLLTVFAFYHLLIIRLWQSRNAMQLNGELLHSASLHGS